MAHTLIVGTTESGKTTLARAEASRLRRAGFKVVVLDPLGDRWDADRIFSDPDAFLRYVSDPRCKRCVLVIDEAGDAVGRLAGPMAWTATRSRHNGHSAIFVTQRAALLDRTVRDQCRYVACFQVSRYDADCLDKEFPQAGFWRALTLPQGHYLFAGRFTGPAEVRAVSWARLQTRAPEAPRNSS